jgi:hypothetical protein
MVDGSVIGPLCGGGNGRDAKRIACTGGAHPVIDPTLREEIGGRFEPRQGQR